jgi:hypothetical protein
MVEFFEAENDSSLADAMMRLYRNPGRRTSLAQQASERFGKTHSWSKHKRVYTRLVGRLVGDIALTDI